MSSILTNNSAMVALQTLKSINSNLAKTQDEISTGKKVATAQDNAAIWSISKVMESDESAFRTIQSNLNMAGNVVATGRGGAERIQGILDKMHQLAISASSDGFDYSTIDTDIASMKEEITSVIDASQLNGVNLLKTNPVAGQTTFSVLASVDRTSGNPVTANASITVTSVNFETSIEAVTIAPITDRATALTARLQIESLIDVAKKGAAALGTAGARINSQASFVSKLADSLKAGAGALVDADMEEASARLQALQTQQQLGVQALSIANQAPQTILSLFR
ncbi:flagellin [Paracoccus aminovorans]|uniref:Flagellin n=1 Tax=Paracoccus aminovorans TaxID=34004 RepID=A0A1I3C5E9_9RHOB|nr:flagellin [Paracoccus aminovorans]CQR84497.1 Flagellin protein FlaA [Paracoccus aminovorans]SFH69762.1 flagellin [Paracoccus aminovorans]